MKHRFAMLKDVPQLARMNRQLVEDEGHRNRLQTDAWLEKRMRAFLTGEYRAVLFDLDGRTVAYVLYTDRTENGDTIYLRQIFVDREFRRRGVGREVMRTLLEEIWPPDRRITVGVLQDNQTAIAFYHATGFEPYAVEFEFPARKKSGGKRPNPRAEKK
jgi:ribosomal protein S18 acetylase RimI-like enzyme